MHLISFMGNCSVNEMKMPPEILTMLLRSGHLNVEERKAKGLWPNEKLQLTEPSSSLYAKHTANFVPEELVGAMLFNISLFAKN